ncbi:NAD(P)-binding domain-containing protein [Demequina litorisediminis]|uniref:Oxidoreductase n=1 Tax=Demequina litorisediminis TaxID=1849022 RepID=A0ABQ6II32_9MICO|nr:NAD(P)-binding domain-containing protein [Demequina litorisediminis]GMA37540.1 oxidoreductase [Demequina litorisediminis]
MSAPSSPVLVIGAGQAGLSVGYHLIRRGLRPGVDFTIVDRGPTAGGAWQHRWDSLRLGDAHRIADLPGMADAGVSFDNAPPSPPASVVVRDYYGAYERHYGLAVQRPVNIASVSRAADGGFDVHAADAAGTFRARVVVAAVGTWGSPRVPSMPGADLFRGLQITTPEFRDAQAFAGLRVAIVGGGASALGMIREIAPVASSVSWFTRRPVTFHDRESSLREDLGRESVRLQDEAARAGRPLPSIVSTTGMPLTPPIARMKREGLLHRLPMFTRMVTDGVVLADGTYAAIDAVVWSIGFDADLGLLSPLGIDARKGVMVSEGHAVAVPGLFLAGYGPQASTISANRGARVIARDIEQFLTDAVWPPVPPSRTAVTSDK